MEEFLLLFRGTGERAAKASPTEMQEHMNKWRSWMDGLASKGKLIGGKPLQSDGKVMRNGGAATTDGPFAEGPEIVGGYLLIKAGSIDEAVSLSKTCPVFEYDGNIEIRAIEEM